MSISLAFPLCTRYVCGMATKAKTKRKEIRDRAAPKKASSYHHGGLRAALIRSAREILESQGYEALTLRAAARRAGANYYLVKPIKQETLAEFAAIFCGAPR